MTSPGAEMPFLDHLEELRQRLIRSLLALVAGIAVGLWMTERFQLVTLLMRPIEPFLPQGQLTVLSPTDPVMIVLKLGFFTGLVLASPVIIYHVWAFLAPALYDRERRVLVPALVAGVVLFGCGAAVAYALVLPKALEVLFSFQSAALTPMITYDAYFDFVLQVVLALGLSFELPLVIVILAALGVVTPRGLGQFRRFAVVLSFVAGALLSPGADVISMIMFTLPLLLLYEVGVAGSVLVYRRRLASTRALAGLLLLGALAVPAGAVSAQQPAPRPTQQAPPAGPDTLPRPPRDTTARPAPARPDAPPRLDSSTVRRQIPKAPSRRFAEPDSALESLLQRPGYVPTRFRADAATLFVREGRLELDGGALTEREGVQLEADTITYDERSCVLRARGDPRLFEQERAVVGEGIRYDVCRKRGVLEDALTAFQQGQTTWFIKGDVAQDSSTTRIFAGSGEITSCDLPVPHYTFRARRIKWVADDIIAARPVTIYVRDVPVFWVPFIFQDVRPGRRSGILQPQVGFGDIVRTSAGYRRQISNIGYYVAASDYWDATVRLDWLSRQQVTMGGELRYNVLDRFLQGDLRTAHTWQAGGGRNLSVGWNHSQRFDRATALTLGVNFATSTAVLGNNALNPVLQTQNIQSRLQLQKQFAWGSLNAGGSRTQPLSPGQPTQTTFPSIGLTFRPLELSRAVTWTPSLTLSSDRSSGQSAGTLVIDRPGGAADTLALTSGTRNLSANFGNQLRIGRFVLPLSLTASDRVTTTRSVAAFRVPDPFAPDDSLDVRRTFPGDFRSDVDWTTSVQLPILFPRTWKVAPSINIQNQVGGPFAVRTRASGGTWVTQGKRLTYALNSAPTVFAFLPGLWPGTSRLRHSLNPTLGFVYAPRTEVNEAYLRATAAPGQPLVTEVRQQMVLTVGLAQVLEGKRRPPRADTTAADTAGGGRPASPVLGPSQGRNFRILSIQSGAVQYDFEQARLPGRTGWTTQLVQHQISSDVIPGFQLSLGTDLWRGQVGTDTAVFSPFVTSASTQFTLTGRTLRGLLGIVGLGGPPGPDGPEQLPDFTAIGQRPAGLANNAFLSANGQTTGAFLQGSPMLMGNQPFAVAVAYTLSRQRPVVLADTVVRTPAQQNLQLSTQFNPTPFWSLRYQGQYDVTARSFQSHNVQLERWLHEWRMQIAFVSSPNGNLSFTFAFYLTDLPQLRIPYNETSIVR